MANKKNIEKIQNTFKEVVMFILTLSQFAWAYILQENIPIKPIWLGIIVTLVFLFLIYYILKTLRPTECKASFSIPGQKDCNIIIKKGSVLKQKGIKVIHLQDTFETTLEKCEKKSLLHAFLKTKGIEKRNLDDSIKNSLKTEGYFPSMIEEPLNSQLRKEGMKTDRYDIGTVARYRFHDKDDYLLVAFSNIEDNKGNVKGKNKKEYIDSVDKVFKGICNTHKGKVLGQIYNVGIWGYQYNQGLFDPTQRIIIMVESFIKNSRIKPFCQTLQICVNGKHANDLDFKEMQIILDYYVKTIEG